MEAETPVAITALYRFVWDVFAEDVNMCLANGYFHGQHSISAHSDDEEQMGDLHDVFCFVTGATRRAIFRTKKSKEVVLDIELPEGCYVMLGESFQSDFTHEFPKMYETAFKSFVEAVPQETRTGLKTTMEKADWILEHADEIRERLRGSKHFASFDKWIQPRYSFTLRQFRESPRKKLKF